MRAPDTIIGQEEAKRLIKLTCPRHLLLIGPPGTGKTTLAAWHANSLGNWYDPINGTVAHRYLHKMVSLKGVIIIDECHVMKAIEALYPMLDLPIEQGMMINPSTGQEESYTKIFILATTDEGMLPPALRSRLLTVALRPYTIPELAQITQLYTEHLRGDTAYRLAEISRGNPRRVKSLGEIVGNIQTNYKRELMPQQVPAMLVAIGMPCGLTLREVEFMRKLAKGTTLSRSSLMGILGMGSETVRAIEADLMGIGLVKITPKGRSLTPDGITTLADVEEALSNNGRNGKPTT